MYTSTIITRHSSNVHFVEFCTKRLAPRISIPSMSVQEQHNVFAVNVMFFCVLAQILLKLDVSVRSRTQIKFACKVTPDPPNLFVCLSPRLRSPFLKIQYGRHAAFAS